MSYCPHCGSPIEEHAIFCGSCGKPVGTAVTPVPNPDTPVTPPTTPIPTNTISYNANNKPDGGNDIQIILKIAIVVLGVAIVVAAIVLLGRCRNSSKPMVTASPDTTAVEDSIVCEDPITEDKNDNQVEDNSLDEKAAYVMVNGHEFVDLGLPSGVKWATCNVGASTPGQDGDYFAWCDDEIYIYTRNGKTTLGASGDAATLSWGDGCRMPTEKEFKELLNNCNYSWTTMYGVKGRKFISKVNSKAFVFFPASGCRDDNNFYSHGSYGNYWSSSFYPSNFDADDAYGLRFSSDFCYLYRGFDRSFGRSVRAVCP